MAPRSTNQRERVKHQKTSGVEMFGSAGQTGTFHFAAQDCGLMVRYGPVKV